MSERPEGEERERLAAALGAAIREWYKGGPYTSPYAYDDMAKFLAARLLRAPVIRDVMIGRTPGPEEKPTR